MKKKIIITVIFSLLILLSVLPIFLMTKVTISTLDSYWAEAIAANDTGFIKSLVEAAVYRLGGSLFLLLHDIIDVIIIIKTWKNNDRRKALE